MNFNDFNNSRTERPTRDSASNRKRDPFEHFDAHEYGGLQVSTRRSALRSRRTHEGRGPGSRTFWRRAMAYAAVSVCCALFSIYLNSFVNSTTAGDTLSTQKTSAAAERKRIVVIDPADQALEDETPNRINREVKGIDPARREMTDAEIAAELNDPLALLVLRKEVFPSSLDDLLKTLDAQNGIPGGLPTQTVFLVGEGSQVRFTAATANLTRQLRFVIGRQGGTNVDLFISVGAGGAPDGFLQVIGWDSKKNAFNYYERGGTNTWVWLGDSNHSLQEPARGQGCFQCHVNGTLLMKELKLPWNNWHSQSQAISASILAPADPLRTNKLFLQALNGGAQDLETFVTAGARRWNLARVNRMIGADGSINNLRLLLRQLFTTTTVNLASTGTQRRVISDATSLRLPPAFFINRSALFDILKLNPDVPVPVVPGSSYRAAESKYQLALVDSVVNFRQPGDTFFAFLVPEPSLEDLAALEQMLAQKIVDQKFVASVLMIDFENPIFSLRREQLLRYLPDSGRFNGGVSDVPGQFVARVKQAAQHLPADSPEQQFLTNWSLPDDQWRAVFTERLRKYLTAVNQKLTTAEGFDGFMRLAISRRVEFSQISNAKNLAEFELLLPQSNVDPMAPLLEMKPDGAVGPK